MTDDHQQRATQIAFNFGPLKGNVEQQTIYTPQPPQAPQPAGQAAEAEEVQEQPSGTQLTITQSVILLSSLLGEPLEQGFGKQKTKLAELISALTGYKASSVRQKIMEIGKMRHYPHNIQQDAEKVAKMIETYNSQVASDIRITYLDD